MREILFRGKTLSGRQWVEGSLLKDEKGLCYIGTYLEATERENSTEYKMASRQQGKTHNRFVGMGFVQVDPKTVCQFTGLTDKNGVKIFEGDIVTCQTKYGADVGQVIFSMGKFVVWWHSEYRYPKNAKIITCYEINSKTKVLGNIFDNPELMKGGADNV